MCATDGDGGYSAANSAGNLRKCCGNTAGMDLRITDYCGMDSVRRVCCFYVV